MDKKILTALAALCMIPLIAPVSAQDADTQVQTSVSSQEDRIYCVGSVSKIYSTAAVMQLVDEGRVELDAPITEYIPDFKMADERYRDITVRMLMNHTSGLPGSDTSNADLYEDNDNYTHDHMLEILAPLQLAAEPGEYAAYCNAGFVLLEIITENVSGMDFTEYIQKNIAPKVGASHTGSAISLLGSDMAAQQVPLYKFGSTRHDYEYQMAIGSGGVYATAPDLANFGSAFFTGNDDLLSEKAKTEMFTRWTEDEDLDGYGLGWDFVEDLKYQNEGIKVVGKGGDVSDMHAQLLVAPDEEISVAVLSANGLSSYNQLMAEALMDVVLEERGKDISDLTAPEPQMIDTIPEKYKGYSGLYFIGSAVGSQIYSITFDGSRMYKQALTTGNSEIIKYSYTADDGFVKVTDSGKMTTDREIVYFDERNGKVYIMADQFTVTAGLGSSVRHTYVGEAMDENPVPDSVQKSIEKLGQSKFVMYNQKYSSTDYNDPFIRTLTDEAYHGYVIGVSNRGTKVSKMIDETHTKAFTTIPSTINRDLLDITLNEKTLADGSGILSFDTSSGSCYRSVDTLPVLTGDTSEIRLTTCEASWYRIGGDLANGTIIAERPEKSNIFVYNRYGEMVWSTHLKGISPEIPLPADGYIVFLGETGDSINIYR